MLHFLAYNIYENACSVLILYIMNNFDRLN